MRSIIYTLAAVGLFFPSLSYAQKVCGLYKPAVKELAERYKEVPRALGMSKDGSVTEVFISNEGTYTILHTLPDGFSCMLDAGDSWEYKSSEVKGTNIVY